jgi:hypothetical protein
VFLVELLHHDGDLNLSVSRRPKSREYKMTDNDTTDVGPSLGQ